jgi:small subunit ribosomal protein S5
MAAQQQRERAQQQNQEFEEKVIHIRRTSKTHQGGRRFRFGAIVAVGDRNGRIGVGIGKAKEVPIAVQKATYAARRNLISVPVLEPNTIPHEVVGTHGSSKILLKPAAAGTGVIAGSVPRTILDLAGFNNLLSKELGSRNMLNIAYATIDGLRQLKTFETAKKEREAGQ